MILTPKDTSAFLHARDQFHIWHLQTKGFAEHGALGDFYDGVINAFDSIVETDQQAGRLAVPTTLAPFKTYEQGIASTYLTDTFAPVVTNQPGVAVAVARACTST